jgi:hypothetical protein
VVVDAVDTVVVVVTMPTQLVVSATHVSSMVAASPSSQCAPAQYGLATHELIPVELG